jgi:hypothetical protein
MYALFDHNVLARPEDILIRSLIRVFAESRSFTASTGKKLPSGFFFKMSKEECTDASQGA